MQRVFYPLGSFGIDKIFAKIPKTECIPYPNDSLETISKEKGDFLIANTRLPINEDTIQKFSGFHGFGTISSGVDHVDFSALKKYGKEFIHAPGSNAGSVAEYVWFGVHQLLNENPHYQFPQPWGIVGMGNVGRALGQVLKNHSIPYFFYDPNVKGSLKWEEVLSLPLVTLHVPLTYQGEHPTIQFLNESHLHFFQDKKIFINTSRGSIVSLKFLECLLENFKILGILDVFDPEPPRHDNLYLKRKDWIFTPHIAGYSQIGRLLGAYKVATQLAKRVGETYPDSFFKFLKLNLEWKTKDFIRKESDLLVQSWEKGDWDYFEKRRNNYPLREDAGVFKYSDNFK